MSILKKWFGPSKDEIWKQLAGEMSADFVDGGLWKGSKVQASVHEWTVTLDTYTVSTGKAYITYTRIRAPYVNKDGFRFKIYRKGFFSDLGKRLGMQDVEVGFLEFDDQFIIQGNDESKLQLLFKNLKIRELIEAQSDISLEVKDDDGWLGAKFPEGVDQLSFQVVGIIKDVERLKLLYTLFAEILNQLCRIGSAYEDDPHIALK
ncbi:DUF3137 domain-containing protein [Spirosoma sp. KCTC 42546]|uniref:DUF3137 domain-containing protein n=1 Tax=Spirosoma sp. KCTC 42546 TaxID=2520506 RepID=UPI00115AB132|nr:DUF3137 domain-containing protein [Spirosoma sp. KCTC 42546]QDK78373.1 DUF3137 domain-containing protein [Spirosoma sp. KCTC 42546]